MPDVSQFQTSEIQRYVQRMFRDLQAGKTNIETQYGFVFVGYVIADQPIVEILEAEQAWDRGAALCQAARIAQETRKAGNANPKTN